MPSPSYFYFCYDLICPFAYLASLEVQALADRCNSKVIYTPTLLGGIYKITTAPQGKDGSALNVMSRPKRVLARKDLRRLITRAGAPNLFPHQGSHKRRSLQAMRALTAAKDEDRRMLTEKLFDAFWRRGLDIGQANILQSVLEEFYSTGKQKSGKGLGKELLGLGDFASKELQDTTKAAAEAGAFGVPTFFVGDQKRMVYGFDRLFILERILGRHDALPLRLMPSTRLETKRVLTFYFDFSSPWSFLGNQQIKALVERTGATLEAIPVLLGAVFKKLGTPNVPLLNISKEKQNYNILDMQYWTNYIGPRGYVQWPDQFPIRTVLPLRATIVQPQLRNALYEAAWQQNKNIGDLNVLRAVISDAGFSTDYIMKHINDQTIKKELFENTAHAVSAGICGVPSFQVNGGEVIFGQDRLNVVEDILCGWKDKSTMRSSL